MFFSFYFKQTLALEDNTIYTNVKEDISTGPHLKELNLENSWNNLAVKFASVPHLLSFLQEAQTELADYRSGKKSR